MDNNYPFTRISLEGIRRAVWEWEGVLPSTPVFWASAELGLAAEPRLKARAEVSADGSVHVTGRLCATYLRTCKRCLTEMAVPVEVELDVWYRVLGAGRTVEDGVVSMPRAAGEISLLEPLREELILARPDYPLCRQDCRGLCPGCGADRNTLACACTGLNVDTRWGPLQSLAEESLAEE